MSSLGDLWARMHTKAEPGLSVLVARAAHLRMPERWGSSRVTCGRYTDDVFVVTLDAYRAREAELEAELEAERAAVRALEERLDRREAEPSTLELYRRLWAAIRDEDDDGEPNP